MHFGVLGTRCFLTDNPNNQT